MKMEHLDTWQLLEHLTSYYLGLSKCRVECSSSQGSLVQRKHSWEIPLESSNCEHRRVKSSFPHKILSFVPAVHKISKWHFNYWDFFHRQIHVLSVFFFPHWELKEGGKKTPRDCKQSSQIYGDFYWGLLLRSSRFHFWTQDRLYTWMTHIIQLQN